MKKTAVTNISKISKLAIAIGFGVVICGTAMGPAFAGGHGEERHHEERHRGHDRDGDHDRAVVVAPAPTYYCEPPPNYYSAPEPYYYPPVYGAPPPPPDGINLFFGHL
jgi:hypothetical protein